MPEETIMPGPRHIATLSLCALLIGALASCSSSSRTAKSSGGQVLNIVASTNVWGDVARQIAGDRAKITSLISNPNADPHSYEASTSNQLAISKADVLIENGGGYDDFVDRMVNSSHSKAAVLNAVTISGKHADADGDLNEHVWYDFPTVSAVVDRMVAAFTTADASESATFTANAARFKAELAGLTQRENDIRNATPTGTAIAITEPVPLYMTTACGLINKTPEQFSHAIEDGSDVPVKVLSDTLALFTNHEVKALIYNEQTSDATTSQVQAQAKKNGIAVVGVTETLPTGTDYLGWMRTNLDAIATAVDR